MQFTQSQLSKALRGARLLDSPSGFAVAYRGEVIHFYPATPLSLVVTDFRWIAGLDGGQYDALRDGPHYVDDMAL